MLVYAVTIFLSAFLLFQIQPMIAKFILPWFGGSAAVWSAALLFFQLLLLAGYTYAHFLIKYLTPKQQIKVHWRRCRSFRPIAGSPSGAGIRHSRFCCC